MDLEPTDTERMLRDTFRSYFTREIEPHVPAMESGAMLPYPLMRPMHDALGLDALLSRTRGGEGSIQSFLVERGTPGLSTGPAMKKMGMRGSPTGEIFLDDVRIPADQLLGGGVRERGHVKSSLASERVGLAVMSYGIAERCYEIARDYALTRRQFGRPIAEFQLVQGRLARMYVALSNMRRIVYADYLAGRTLNERVADVCAGKLYCAEMGTFVAFEAIHILAGNGYMEEYVVERLARDAKLIELGGGTTEMQILTIARELLHDRASPRN
jgi:alkylation response protein AidB-like acyl-CoA dehydrogenase